jgi:hypothetical protein
MALIAFPDARLITSSLAPAPMEETDVNPVEECPGNGVSDSDCISGRSSQCGDDGR